MNERRPVTTEPYTVGNLTSRAKALELDGDVRDECLQRGLKRPSIKEITQAVAAIRKRTHQKAKGQITPVDVLSELKLIQ